MSLMLTVAQARLADKGNPLPGLQGKVKKVFQQKEKPSRQQGHEGETYLDQGIVITDLADPKAELIVSFYDRVEFGPEVEGKLIHIIPGPKGGLKSNGTYDKLDAKGNQQTNYTATVTSACEVTFGGAAAAAPAARPQPPRPAAPAPQAPAPRPPAPAAPPAQLGALSWEEYLQIEGEIMTRCILAASSILSKTTEAIAVVAGVGPEPAQVVELAIGLRMGGAKVGLTHDSRFDLPGRATINPPTALSPEDPGPGLEDNPPF